MNDLRQAPLPTRAPSRSAPPSVEIVIPVYNEAGCLEASVTRLTTYLRTAFPLTWRVTIADNASTDDTLAVASRLASLDRGIHVRHLDEKGRGRALRAAWLASDAEVVCYMDVDLSTGLEALLPLVAPLLTGHSDIAIGTRLSPSSSVVRGPKRELISRIYNHLLHVVLRSRVTDAQCGFKAVRAEVARVLVPLVEDEAWFFDTELLVLAERNGMRIHEVPVDWTDDPDSRVDVVGTAVEDLRGVVRMLRSRTAGIGRLEGSPARLDHDLASDARRFAGVGVPSTIAWLILTVLFRPLWGLPVSNAVAVTICAAGNFAAHRSLASRRSRPVDHWRDLELLAGGSLVATLAATTLGLLAASAAGAGLPIALAGAAVGGAIVSLGRFLVVRALVVRRAGTN